MSLKYKSCSHMNKMPGLVFFFLFWGCCALSSERTCFGSKNVRRGEDYLNKGLEAEIVENSNNKSLGYQLVGLGLLPIRRFGTAQYKLNAS